MLKPAKLGLTISIVLLLNVLSRKKVIILREIRAFVELRMKI